jgi:hypothetical protein
MRRAWILTALLALGTPAAGQVQGVLHIKVTVLDARSRPCRCRGMCSSSATTRRPPSRGAWSLGDRDRGRQAEGGFLHRRVRSAVWLRRQGLPANAADRHAGGRGRDAGAHPRQRGSHPLTSSSSTAGTADSDTSSILATWQNSVVAVWLPISRGTGFVVDRAGLIATDRSTVGGSTSLEVQLSPTVKVNARVLSADAGPNAAILWSMPRQWARHRPCRSRAPRRRRWTNARKSCRWPRSCGVERT